MTQLSFPGLEPPNAACLIPHPLLSQSLCIYATGHGGKHGVMIPGTSMIQEWGEDGVAKLYILPTTESKANKRRRYRAS